LIWLKSGETTTQMGSRRSFLKNVAWLAPLAGTGLRCTVEEVADKPPFQPKQGQLPIIVSTWNFGTKANEVAWETLGRGGNALDAVEQGVRLAESDPTVSTVGYGGMPDREGRVTLDACVMTGDGRCGAVCFLEDIKNPVSVARKVMEETPHVMLAGEGARAFALGQGFTAENLLTDNARNAWEKWKQESNYEPVINIENHDTIGMLALDEKGQLAGACTTSGLAFKMRGRIGDSPMIGPGLFVAEGVGGAVATGMGEEIIRENCSFLAVEFLRQGYSAQKAAEMALARIKIRPGDNPFQACVVVLRADGDIGGAGLREGFSYAKKTPSEAGLVSAPSIIPTSG
jgi:N4-(beta-N-acetylglucosaminyl)-L-asparaginase